MRRVVPWVAVLLVGCASSAETAPQRVEETPLATGVFHRLMSYDSYPYWIPADGDFQRFNDVYNGSRCAIYVDWVRVDGKDGAIWMIPRESLSFIELKAK